ncbi:MAG: hypothetical protein ACK4GW_11150 [Pseudorhodobacter sp.]
MGAITIQQMADRVDELLEERLGLRGDGLRGRLKKGRRILPRKVLRAATDLAEAAEQSHNAKLLLQIDEGLVAANYDICVKHLSGLNRWHRRKGILLGLTTSILFSLLMVAGMVLAVLVWRGFL